MNADGVAPQGKWSSDWQIKVTVCSRHSTQREVWRGTPSTNSSMRIELCEAQSNAPRSPSAYIWPDASERSDAGIMRSWSKSPASVPRSPGYSPQPLTRPDGHSPGVFLHITSGPDSTNNILALAFGLLIAFVVIAGTIWIVTDLNDNMMMPSSDPMNMPMQCWNRERCERGDAEHGACRSR